MQAAHAIEQVPLAVALALSLLLHGAVLGRKGWTRPPEARLEAGRTVVHLTLQPSIARSAELPEPAPEPMPEPEPVAVPEPVMVAMPEPVTETAPAVEPAETAPRPEPAAIEQAASPIESKGVESEASVLGTFSPAYPRMSQRRNEEGTVRVSIGVRADGTAGRVEILQSSGFHRLDEAALEGARKTSFAPALRRNRPVESTIELSFTFRLTNE